MLAEAMQGDKSPVIIGACFEGCPVIFNGFINGQGTLGRRAAFEQGRYRLRYRVMRFMPDTGFKDQADLNNFLRPGVDPVKRDVIVAIDEIARLQAKVEANGIMYLRRNTSVTHRGQR